MARATQTTERCSNSSVPLKNRIIRMKVYIKFLPNLLNFPLSYVLNHLLGGFEISRVLKSFSPWQNIVLPAALHLGVGADWFASIGSVDVVRIRWELVRDTYRVYWVRNWGKRRNRLAADYSKTWVDGDKSNNELLTVDRRIISSTDKNRLHRYCKDVNSTFHVEEKIVNFVWH